MRAPRSGTCASHHGSRGLGRALALSGDKVKAKIVYEDLLNLWNGADPNTSLLEQAKAEYARQQLRDRAK
jgi:hypothetical protein